MSEPVAWYVRHSANEPPLLFTDEERAKKAAFSCGCGAKPLYLSQVSPQENSTDATKNLRQPAGIHGDPVQRMCEKALTQLGLQWQNKIDAAWGVKTPNDATPMAGSGPTVPADDRGSDCSEDGRARASASSIGNTHEPVAWAALRDDGDIAWIGYTPDGAADGACGRQIVPLYRSPTLTDAEREAIQFLLRHAAWACDREAFPDSGDYRKRHDEVFRLMGRK